MSWSGAAGSRVGALGGFLCARYPGGSSFKVAFSRQAGENSTYVQKIVCEGEGSRVVLASGGGRLVSTCHGNSLVPNLDCGWEPQGAGIHRAREHAVFGFSGIRRQPLDVSTAGFIRRAFVGSLKVLSDIPGGDKENLTNAQCLLMARLCI